MNTLATPRNMELARRAANESIAAPGVFAYSPATGERYSASPGDYWDSPQDRPLLDSEGKAMILATERSMILPA